MTVLMNGYTILVLAGVMQLIAACAGLLVQGTDATRQVMRWWVVAQVIAAFAHLFLLTAFPIGSFFATGLLNATVCLSLAVLLYAMAIFFHRPVRVLLGTSLVLILLMLFSRDLTETEAQRLQLGSAINAFQFFQLGYQYWRAKGSRSTVTISLMLANLLVAFFMTVRVIEAAHAETGYDFSHAGIAQHIALVGYFAGMVVNGFGFLLILIDHGTEEQLRLSSLDSLTETLNRRSFLDIGKQQLAVAERGQFPVSVLICDLDHFKQFNDRHGHTAGDQVILALVAVARQTIRSGDCLARWGGEEFVLLLPQTDRAGAVQIGQRLNTSFAARGIGHEGITLHATVSVGVAEHRMGEDIQQTIDRADRALLKAKAEGRNRVEAG